ncbi:MAG: hypothetical protein IPM15_19485 [Betaproteobacteria bacterium]|jgi:ABC-type phosphate transport system substrate-binding protein|nr:hypothetical protein [Betaproteobacteria bacterium]
MQALLVLVRALCRLPHLVALWLLLAAGAHAADFVVIGHPNVPRVDAATLQRLYTGRAIEVAGQPVTVVGIVAGHPLRERFLMQVVGLDDERYVAYWTVRRHVGRGAPPREFRTSADVAAHVLATPGALGYVAAADVTPGMNVVLRP